MTINTKTRIKMTLTGNKKIEMKFSDSKDAYELYQNVKNIMMFMNQPVKEIELV
jgi:hypothetical protein